MSVITDTEKCNACAQLPEGPRCVDLCPGDLMCIAADGKAHIRDDRDCWDCFTCIKACPRGALACKLPYQLANYKATLQPRVKKDRIEWTLTYPDGRTESFELPTLEA